MVQPLTKENELIERYNAINPHEGSFRLRRILKEAEYDFKVNGSLLSGIIWASCETDLGHLSKAEGIFAQLVQQIPLNTENSWSQNLYLFYARLLGYTGRVSEAIQLLDNFSQQIEQIGTGNLWWILDFYAEAGQLHKILEIQKAFFQRNPDKRLIQGSAILYTLLILGEQEVFVESFFEHAEIFGFSDTNLSNLDQIMDKIAGQLLYPGLKPNLTDNEFERLDKIRQAMYDYLVKEEEWELQAATEAVQRLNDPSDEIISFEQVVKDLGLENAI